MPKGFQGAHFLIGLSFLVVPSVFAGSACSGDSSATGASDGTGGTGGTGGAGQGGSTIFTSGTGIAPCDGLRCQQVTCPSGGATRVTGIVYEPAGKVPLYNVVVYVPNAPLQPVPEELTCDQCGAKLSGDPVVTTITDTQGRFVLENVPVGDNIPLVIQVGKWRRELTLPKVEACADNPTEDKSIRMPRNQSEGHIPKIALSTGGADPLECWLRKIGLDDAEFTPEEGSGRVNLFAGPGVPPDVGPGSSRYADSLNDGAAFDPATSLWGSVESLKRYDVVLLSCEGAQNGSQKPLGARLAMLDYLLQGGRVFASHWHNYWLVAPDPFPELATWEFMDDPPEHDFVVRVDTSFPKGQALADWLLHVGASSTLGEIELIDPQHTVNSVQADRATRWIYSEESDQYPVAGVQYFTFNTPIAAPESKQCGRMVYSDIHVSSGDTIGAPFPDGCTQPDLSAQEKALLFMLFDLSACIAPDDEPPELPK